MTRVTLADVAREVGCSAKSVSNVVRGRGGVSPETRERVLEAIERLGYIADPAGRALASGRTDRIAIVVPHLHQPYFAEVAEALIHEIDARGLASTLVLAPDQSHELRALAERHDVDGVIICPHSPLDERVRERVENARPTVQLGGDLSIFDRVQMGEREGFRLLTEHLLERGRRRFALVWHGDRARGPRGPRFDGFIDALTAADIDWDPRLIAYGSDWDRRASGYEAMTSLLASGHEFDAVMCVNDAMAIGAMRALRGAGVRVPDDVALTGFDNTAEAAHLVPALTTVGPRTPEMVRSAVRMLCERIDGFDGPSRVILAGADLVLRASS